MPRLIMPLLVLVCLCVSTSEILAQSNWAGWRGPLGTGEAPEASPPIDWTPTENVRWKTALPGRGHSTPIVWQDLIFVTTAVPVGEKLTPKMSGRPGAHDNLPVDQKHRFQVIAIERGGGTILWTKTVNEVVPHEGGHYTASLASASPVTDGEHVFAHFGSHGLYCLDFGGNVLWEKQLGKMHSKHGHGEGASPVLHGETLFVNWDHEEQSFLVAFDKRTGAEKWRRMREEVTSWSSPIVIEVDDKAQVVVCGTERVRGYDLESGDVIWECGGLSANICASPVAADGIVYVGSSYGIRSVMGISVEGARGDLTGTDRVLWMKTRGTPYVPSLLLYDGALFYLTHYQNVLTRLIARSGEPSPGAMRLGELGNIYASPVGAGGYVYITDLEGVTQVITNSDVPRIVAANQIGEPVSASAAIAGDAIYLRGDEHLFCIAED